MPRVAVAVVTEDGERIDGVLRDLSPDAVAVECEAPKGVRPNVIHLPEGTTLRVTKIIWHSRYAFGLDIERPRGSFATIVRNLVDGAAGASSFG